MTDIESKASESTEILSHDELNRFSQLRYAPDRWHRLSCRAVLRLLLGYYLDTAPKTLSFCTNPWGKPYLYQPSTQEKLYFNLSHSQGLALFGLSRYDIGVDLEHIKSGLPFDSIATQVFSRPEIAALSLAPPDLARRRFFDYWTGKEAYVKGVGRGLSIDLTKIDIAAFGAQPIVISTNLKQAGIRPETWSLYPFNIASGYSAAVALKSHRKIIFHSVVIETGKLDFRNWTATKQALTEMLAKAPNSTHEASSNGNRISNSRP